MKITVIGTGYVGLTAAVCLAELGHRVVGVDVDQDKVAAIQNGKLPIHEPGLLDIFKRYAGTRLTFTTVLEGAVAMAEIVIIAVGTPQGKDGDADLTALKEVAAQLGRVINNYKIVIIKSTVPVGTGEQVAEIIRKYQPSPIPFDMASNPEFLRQGSAVNDFLYPDRIVVGFEKPAVGMVLRSMYLNISAPIVETDIRTAELIKYASNGFLATKISFINELARFSEKIDVDINKVAEGMGLDSRIGQKFLHAGVGFGGSCFPKDVAALTSLGKKSGLELSLLQTVLEINRTQKKWFFDKIKHSIGTLKGKKVGILGLSFKPDTDDMREAPSRDIITWLEKEGAIVKAYDPVAMKNAKNIFPKVQYMDNPYQVAQSSSAVIILTEWPEFKKLNWQKVKDSMAGNLIFDGRNFLSPSKITGFGLRYHGIGGKRI